MPAMFERDRNPLSSSSLPASISLVGTNRPNEEAIFKADLERLLKREGHMPEGQVPGYEPERKTSWGRICEHATRRRWGQPLIVVWLVLSVKRLPSWT
jgi:hypothetical protein